MGEFYTPCYFTSKPLLGCLTVPKAASPRPNIIGSI